MPRSKRRRTNRFWHQLFLRRTLIRCVSFVPTVVQKGKIELSLLISPLPHQGENKPFNKDAI